MSLIGSTHAPPAAPPVDAAPSTTVWSTPARTESGVARVREATAGELEAWDTLVARFWNHRVTHRRSWIESLAGSGCGEPLYLVWEKHGEVVGCMPGLLARVGLWRGFGSPLAGWQTGSPGAGWGQPRPAGARRAVAGLRPAPAGLADGEPRARVGSAPCLGPRAPQPADAVPAAGASRELHRAHDVRRGAGPDARARVPRRAGADVSRRPLPRR